MSDEMKRFSSVIEKWIRFASDKQTLKNRSLTMLEYYFHERIYGMEWKGMHVMAYILLRKEYE